MAKFGFTDNDGADVGEKYVTKEYAIDVYPNIFTNISMAGLYTWGNSTGVGTLGDGSTSNRSSPGTTAGGGLNWRTVYCNAIGSAVGVKNDGTLWTWGLGAYGALGSNGTANRSSPVTTSGGGTDWAAVPTGIGGQDYLAAIKSTGTLWTWGRGNQGRLGSNGTGNRSSPVTVVGGITDWIMASCGYQHMAAIRSTGQLYTWGQNNSGQLGSNNTTNRSSPVTTVGGGTNWVYCSASVDNTAAIKSDGTLWTWGSNALGQLGDGATGASRSSPNTISGGGTNWKAVAAGATHMAAVKTDGTLWTWGSNASGQLGTGATTTASRSSPGTTAGGGLNWVKVSSGDPNTAGIKSDGTLWTWGWGNSGQLGTGDTVDRSSPGTTVSGGTNWKFVNISRNSSPMAINEEDGW